MQVKSSSVIARNVKNVKLKHAILIALGSLNAIISVLFALSIQLVLDGFINSATAKVSGVNAVIISVSLLIASFLITALTNVLNEKFKIDAEITIKKDMLLGYLSMPYIKSQNLQSGEVISRIQTDTATFASSYIMILPQLVTVVVRVVAIAVALFILSPVFTAVLVGAGAVIVLITFIIRKITKRLYKATREKDEKVTSIITETTENLLTVKGFKAEDVIHNKVSTNLSYYEKARKKQRYFQAGFSVATSLLFNVVYLVAVIIAVTVSVGGNFEAQTFTGLTLVSIVQLLMQARTPISSFGSILNLYYETEVLADRIIELNHITYSYCAPDAEFEGVSFYGASFKYDNENIIENFSTYIESGKKVLIKGKTGAGKSTLLKLIAGVYEPDSGYVEGKFDKGSIATSKIKGIFAVALQGNMLFSGSLKENLTLLNPSATDEDINKAIQFACLSDVIDAVGGLDGIIGENGNTISQGQGQRVAIARAYLSKRPVLLLDEPTSALDAVTSKTILTNIKNLDRTVIMVSHEETADLYVDKVIDLNTVNN